MLQVSITHKSCCLRARCGKHVVLDLFLRSVLVHSASSLGHLQFHCQFLHSSISLGPISSHSLAPNNRIDASLFDPTTCIRMRAGWRSDELRGSFNPPPAIFLLRAPLPSLLSSFALVVSSPRFLYGFHLLCGYDSAFADTSHVQILRMCRYFAWESESRDDGIQASVVASPSSVSD